MGSMSLTPSRLARALAERPGSSAGELVHLLDIDKRTINRLLYSRRDLFFGLGDAPPRWWNADPAGLTSDDAEGVLLVEVEGDPIPGTTERPVVAGFVLYQWQEQALAAWEEHGRCGIIQAVTGAGKTAVGVAAIAQHLDEGGKAAVIVPTIELLRQWTAILEARLPGTALGTLGGGGSDNLSLCDVLVAVSASASRYELGLGNSAGLLVADECHRYAAPQLRLALEEPFGSRLGLSATYERTDGLHEEVLIPYFGQVVCSLGYQDAIRDGVVAHFKVALVPVVFQPGEAREYERLSEQLRRARSRLVLEFGAPEEPFGEFMAFVTSLARTGTRSEGIAASKYLSAFNGRGKLLAETPAKTDALWSLTSAMALADRTIIFTHSIKSAEAAAATVVESGLSAEATHSGLNSGARRDVLARFASGDLDVVVAPRVLDEGVDVPAADLAIIIAASHQRRQMIQRMGRVLRVKTDNRLARFVIVYVEGTSEDPALGAHESFIDEMIEVADDVRQFRGNETANEIATYLRPTTSSA